MKNLKLTKDEVKSKNVVLIITSIFTLLIGLSFFIFEFMPLIESKTIFYVAMLLYFGAEFTNYLLTRRVTGMHSLYISLACIFASLAGLLYIKEASNMLISIILICWILMMIVIKLIRINVLRNERNYSVFINLFSLSMFILLGILTITNIYTSLTNECMMLGFFFTVNGILNLIENIGNIKFCK